jgi:O-antigen ligase/polysaccharide polymerase Wzy-like membrane protein
VQLSASRNQLVLEKIGGSAFLFFTGLVLMYLVAKLSTKLSASDMIALVCIDLLFSICVFFALAATRPITLDQTTAAYTVLLVIWAFLVGDDAIFSFNRVNPLSSETVAQYKPTAYGQAIFWVLCSLFVVVISLPKARALWKTLFSSANKWPTFFALLCLVSTAWAVQPFYSLAWAFKLVLTVWILAYVVLPDKPQDVKNFLLSILAMFCVIIVLSVVKAIVDPADAFKSNRLAGVVDPTDTSETAGLALIISVALYHWGKKKGYLVLAAVSSVVMILGGGKTACVAALVSCLLFFFLQKRFKSVAIFLLSIGMLAVVLYSFTPIGNYYSGFSSDQLETFTGRTILWEHALPEIKAHLLLGHGYMSEKFYNLNVPGVGGWEVGHMHNAFLSVLYDEGLPGLFLVVMMCYVTSMNLWTAWKKRWEPEVRILTVAFMALFVCLFLNGLLSTPFGGRPFGFHLIFLSCVVFSAKLRYGLGRQSALGPQQGV